VRSYVTTTIESVPVRIDEGLDGRNNEAYAKLFS
jgi:hypothetical protein